MYRSKYTSLIQGLFCIAAVFMILILGLGHGALAQQVGVAGTLDRTAPDTTYFKVYQDYLTISPYLGLANLSLDVSPRHSTEAALSTTYVSNNYYHIGLGLSYNDLALFVGMGTGISNFPSARYGQTKYSDYAVSLISGAWMNRAGLMTYQGFSETTAGSYVPNFSETSPYPFRHDLSYTELRLSSAYFFNHRKFDANTVVNMAGKLKRSANSFWLRGGLELQGMLGDSSWVPTGRANVYQTDTRGLKQMSNLAFQLLPGWAGVVTGRHWFFSGFVGLGARANYNVITKTSGTYGEWGVNPDTHLRIIFGYNTERWFFNIDSEANVKLMEADVFTLAQAHSQVYYTVGYRIYSPKLGQFLRKVPVLRRFV